MNFLPQKTRLLTFAAILFSTAILPGPTHASAKKSKSDEKAKSATPSSRRSAETRIQDRDEKAAEGRKRAKSLTNENFSKSAKRQTSSEPASVVRKTEGGLTSEQQKEATSRAGLRRAEAARTEAISRQRAKVESLRDDVQAMIAKDELSGEDPEVRSAAISALGNRAGTVVVMNPKTGRIYSIVNQEWAVREGFKPCSTIKLVTGLAGLNEQGIDSNDTTNNSDSNNVSLTKALAYSKNGYFQTVGGELGFEKMISYAHRLGLGEKTGINMRSEIAGQLPDSNARPGIARMSSHGDSFEVTPLQLATLVSAIGNGGKLVAPVIVRSRQDELKFRPKVRRQIAIDAEALRNLLPGMVGSVNYGSGRKAHDPAQTVVGKTGTCIEREGWVGLFTSFAPLSNPTLAVVVITRGADAQGHVPAAVAGQIYRDLNHRFGRADNVQVASGRKSFTLETDKISTNRKESVASVNLISEQDRNEMGNRTRLGGSKNSSSSMVKPVLMQVPKREPEILTPKVVLPEPTTTDGGTRPRRVASR